MQAKKKHEKRCANCHAVNCHSDKQQDFDELQLQSADAHDQMLVEARMVGFSSSFKSRKNAGKSREFKENLKQTRQSDYLLTRVIASMQKIGTFLRRRPRAKTDLKAFPPHALEVPMETPLRNDTY